MANREFIHCAKKGMKAYFHDEKQAQGSPLRVSRIENREYRYSENFLCNKCPLNHEGRTRVRGEIIYDYVPRPSCRRRKNCTKKHIYT